MSDPNTELRKPTVREIAESTFQHLQEFSIFLEDLSLQIAELELGTEFFDKMIQLMEGIKTFTEAVTGVRNLLQIQKIPLIDALEKDLLSILKTLLEQQENGHFENMRALLREH